MDRTIGARRWTRARNAVSALRAFQRPYSKVDLPTSTARIMTEPRKRSKKGCIALSACLVFVAAVAVIGTAVGVTESKKRHNDDSDVSSVTSICSRTLYPDDCNSTLAGSNPQEFVAIAMEAAMAGIRKSLWAVESLHSSSPVKNGTQYSTLEMCKEVLTDSLEQVNASLSMLRTNVTTMKLADVQQYMAAALTYQDTCVDGVMQFGVWNTSDALYGAHSGHVTRMLSNALSLVNSLAKVTDWSQVLRGHSRRLQAEVQEEVPHWVHRRLLQSNPTANAVVAKDGSGKFTSIQAAVDAAPTSGARWVIYVKKGVYNEYVSIPKNKKNLMMYGDGPGATVITGSKSVKGSGVTTFLSATFAVVSPGFIMKDMTIQNTAGAAGEQAVALRAGGDQQAFSNVNLEGYQDTLYAHTLRQFYTGCTILGTIDYIFGNAAAVFQNCNLRARLGRPSSQNIYTASGRTDPGQKTGFSFLSCTVGAAPGLPDSYPTYLGRPWKPYAQTVFIKSNLASNINPAGWLLWNGDPNSGKSVSYGEYGNTGPGATTGSRVSWSRQISISEANKFTVSSFIAGQQWLPATSLPFNAAL